MYIKPPMQTQLKTLNPYCNDSERVIQLIMLHSVVEATVNSKIEAYGVTERLRDVIKRLDTGEEIVPTHFEIYPSVINDLVMFNVAGLGSISVKDNVVTISIDEEQLANYLLFLVARENMAVTLSPALRPIAMCDDVLRIFLAQIGCGVIECGLARYQTFSYEQQFVNVASARTPSGALSTKHSYQYAELDAEYHITFHGTKFPKELKPKKFVLAQSIETTF